MAREEVAAGRAADDTASPPSPWRIILWLIPVVAGIVVALVWLLSLALTFDAGAKVPKAEPEAVLATCDFDGVEGILVTLSCESGMRRALVAGIRPLAGVSAAAARAGLSSGLSDYAGLSEGRDVRCEVLAGEPPRARCTGEAGDLARFLVEAGAAGAASAELSDVQYAARSARAGLHADAVAALANRRAQIQTWLATAIGLTVALAGFLYGSYRTMRGWERTQKMRADAARRVLDECNRRYVYWVSDPVSEADAFRERLLDLDDSLRGLGETFDWIAHQRSRIALLVRSVDRIKEDAMKGGTQPETAGVEKAWIEVFISMNAAVEGKIRRGGA